MSHPIDIPTFDWQNSKPVWYLAHPVASDERFTYEQNLAHILHMMTLCFDEGFITIAPYHTHCLVLDDKNIAHRTMGLMADCKVVCGLGRIILTGHRISRGMQTEIDSLSGSSSYELIDLTELCDEDVRLTLREYASQM